MRSNVIGRVKNTPLPKSQGLLPLYEAIINSIDAIEDSRRGLVDGKIEIRILRQYQELVIAETEEQDLLSRNPIRGFEVSDNGIGFNDQNYRAFNEADTQYKANKGGKGVGRFVWLKAFEKVEIDSTFLENGKLSNRTFVFSLASADGISEHKLIEETVIDHENTVVRLLNFKEQYETRIPRNAQTISKRIVEHCMKYYVLSNMPIVKLYDLVDEEPIDFDNVYENLVANTEKEAFSIDEHEFEVIHFLLHSSAAMQHSISYCANLRVVKKQNITNKIPNLPTSLSIGDDDGACVYSGYVSSEYLNERVNQQRTDFVTTPEEDLLRFPGELTWSDIEAKVLFVSRELLQPFTDTVRVEKENRIREYVEKNAPQYRHVVKNHPEKLDKIQPNISDEKLDTDLYELHRQIELELREEADEFLELGDDLFSGNGQTYKEALNKFSRFWQEMNEVGKANLAQYIVHRKMLLEFFEIALQRQSTGRYSLEETIHQFIFPLKKTSDDVDYDQHNLWIIDEKLSYHQYLASDVPLKNIDVLESKSLSRPDLFILFDQPIAVVDEESPFNSGIVIFEFKRPMRDDYNAEENPIQQVLKYVDEIKAGRVLDKNGRPFNIPDTTPFYCYVICDLTVRLKNQARYANLRLTPDAGGYFGYNSDVGAYLEVIGFDKLVRDAKKRNRILFDKLNLPYKL